jgi:putative copper export protein
MHWLYIVSVWLHILAAATWVGGMVFLVLVLLPVTRRAEYRGAAAGLINWTGVRFRFVGWVCFGLLIASGIVNLLYRGVGWNELTSGEFWAGGFGRAFGLKMILVAVILVGSAIHDFYMGPRATAAWEQDPTSPRAKSLRVQATMFGRVNMLLALAVVILAVIMVRGWG